MTNPALWVYGEKRKGLFYMWVDVRDSLTCFVLASTTVLLTLKNITLPNLPLESLRHNMVSVIEKSLQVRGGKLMGQTKCLLSGKRKLVIISEKYIQRLEEGLHNSALSMTLRV